MTLLKIILNKNKILVQILKEISLRKKKKKSQLSKLRIKKAPFIKIIIIIFMKIILFLIASLYNNSHNIIKIHKFKIVKSYLKKTQNNSQQMIMFFLN
jgi:hypothetical protein